jgi:hypothetical protein
MTLRHPTREAQMSLTTREINVGGYVLVVHEGTLTRGKFEKARSSVKRILDEHGCDLPPDLVPHSESEYSFDAF